MYQASFYRKMDKIAVETSQTLVPQAKTILAKYNFQFPDEVIAGAIRYISNIKNIILLNPDQEGLEKVLNEKDLLNAMLFYYRARVREKLLQLRAIFDQNDSPVEDSIKQAEQGRFIYNLINIVGEFDSGDTNRNPQDELALAQQLVDECNSNLDNVKDAQLVSFLKTCTDFLKACLMIITFSLYYDQRVAFKYAESGGFVNTFFIKKTMYDVGFDSIKGHVDEFNALCGEAATEYLV